MGKSRWRDKQCSQFARFSMTLGGGNANKLGVMARTEMKPIPGNRRILLWVALIHVLLAFFVAPIGWYHLYQWDSPHSLRAIWACIFNLPLSIVFGWFVAFRAPALGFLLIPLNSLVFSWLIVTPLSTFLKFRQTGQRRDLMHASLYLGISAALLGVVGTLWIPPNIISQKEACMHNIRQLDVAARGLDGTNNETPHVLVSPQVVTLDHEMANISVTRATPIFKKASQINAPPESPKP